MKGINEMIFEYLEAGPLLTNCYIIGDEKTKEAVVVDPGGSVDRILMVLSRFKLSVKLIVNTHAHPDHVGGNAGLVKATGAPIAIHRIEAPLLKNMAAIGLGIGIPVENSPEATRILEEGDIIKVSGITMKVLHIPGHSPGSICLVIEGTNKVVVGDVLFRLSIGRTDFPGGSFEALISGIKEKLYPLGDNIETYPGHGPPTTIGYERKYNPFLTGQVTL